MIAYPTVAWAARHDAPSARQAPAWATVSTSTSMRGSMRPLTSTMVVSGRCSPKKSPWARPTSSAREMSVT